MLRFKNCHSCSHLRLSWLLIDFETVSYDAEYSGQCLNGSQTFLCLKLLQFVEKAVHYDFLEHLVDSDWDMNFGC